MRFQSLFETCITCPQKCSPYDRLFLAWHVLHKWATFSTAFYAASLNEAECDFLEHHMIEKTKIWSSSILIFAKTIKPFIFMYHQIFNINNLYNIQIFMLRQKIEQLAAAYFFQFEFGDTRWYKIWLRKTAIWKL